MRFSSTVLALAGLPAVVFGTTFTVNVGAGGKLKFDPQNITAAVGDTVQFQFSNKNHSVTQTSFATPCTAFNGVDSGFLAVPPGMTFANGTNPTWTFSVTNDTKPLWFRCAQTKPVVHCAKGMVFSINATPQKSFDKFLANALATPNTTDTATSNATNTTTPNTTDTATPLGAGSPSAASPSAASASGGASGSAAAAQASPSVKKNGASTVMLNRGTAVLMLGAVGLGVLVL